MASVIWSRGAWACVSLSLFIGAGCSKPQPIGGTGTAPAAPTTTVTPTPVQPPAIPATANTDDVKAARARIVALGSKATCAPDHGDLLTEVVISNGSNVTAEDLTLFGKLTDLKKLQIKDCRSLNDEMAAQLSSLKGLTSLALTNTIINDVTVEMIAKSFPNLVELDLSSNTNMTSSVVKIVSAMPQLRSLTLIQNQVNDIGAMKLAKLPELQSLDLRGNMEAGDMALEVVAALPKLKTFKHRSTAVSDAGLEYLSQSQTLDSLLMQDFNVTSQSGPHLAKLGKLTQLEIFRCQGFGSEGVLALKGMGLTRLTLRDLPNVSDPAMEVFDDLPKLRWLRLWELASVSDSGLKHLAALQSLEQLNIWSLPQMTDATVDVIVTLPKLKDLTIRSTGVTDATIDKLLGMKGLQSLTFNENGAVTAEGLKKLATRKWTNLTLGTAGAGEAAAP
jgi:Leucine rich repeat